MKKKKKYTLADFKKLQFSSGETNLSQQIDEICYGSQSKLAKINKSV